MGFPKTFHVTYLHESGEVARVDVFTRWPERVVLANNTLTLFWVSPIVIYTVGGEEVDNFSSSLTLKEAEVLNFNELLRMFLR